MTIPVGVLGATGAVGQRLVGLLADHPEFDLATVTASNDSAGKSYASAANWLLPSDVPPDVAEQTVRRTEPRAIRDDIELLFSALPSGVASDVEPTLAQAGYVISSNASNARLAADVPLVIPEINANHLAVLPVQRENRGWDGALVKNPNCSTIAFVPTVAALEPWNPQRVHVATLQSVSGAGYSGVTASEILDNVIPHIPGEAEKLERESRKVLGTLQGDQIVDDEIQVSASVNRVPTVDGHLENVWVETTESPSISTVREAMETFAGVDLPSAPPRVLEVIDRVDRPQPRLDRERSGGMSVIVGGIESSRFGLQYDCLAHNTLRGAAGASLLNGELLLADGYL